MRVAALFDVHGNLPAFEAVLADVETSGADLVVCGGDAVPGPFPGETLALLRALGQRLVYVRGNGERAVVAAAEPEARWCGERLDPADLAWLADLPLTATVPVERLGDVLFCHGTPRSDEEIVTLVTPDERLAAILADVAAPLVVAGHTHSQLERAVGATRFVNAGSVGMPYEHERGAYWALLGPDVEFRRTPYDANAAAERIRASAYPGADAFAREYVLSLFPPEETASYFEEQARGREE